MQNLTWMLPRNDKFNQLEKLGSDVKRILERYSFTAINLKNPNLEDIAENFCNSFFQNFGMGVNAYISNLTLKANPEGKVTLCIRIPAHPLFNNPNSGIPISHSLAVLGDYRIDNKNQSSAFIPKRIILTSDGANALAYEKEVTLNFHKIQNLRDIGKFQNQITQKYVLSLPKLNNNTEKRLKEWDDFIDFKENLIKEKSKGLRFLEWDSHIDDGYFEFLCVAESEEELRSQIRGLRRQSLNAFNVNSSTDNYNFKLAQDPKNPNNQIRADFNEIGQLSNDRIEVLSRTATDDKLRREWSSTRSLYNNITNKNNNRTNGKKSIFENENVVFARIKVELSESIQNAYNREINQSPDNKRDAASANFVNSRFFKLPKFGFLAASLVGDLSLVNRHRSQIKNLLYNDHNYAPKLSTYLFDISKAKVPAIIPEINDWENPNLNESQKMAVRKMLAAEEICLIQGPPGTGKTTVIAEACYQFAKRGYKVLIASQSHDALDNALSRLQNNPLVRAIRLARFENRITDDGKEFTGEKVLEKQYSALLDHVTKGYLEPIDEIDQRITERKELLNKANAINDELSELRERFRAEYREAQKYKKNQDTIESINGSLTDLKAIGNYLRSGGQIPNLTHFKLENLTSIQEMVKLLQDYSDIDLIQNKEYSFDRFSSNVGDQFAVLANQLNSWRFVLNLKRQLKADILKLQQPDTSSVTDHSAEIDRLQEELDKTVQELNQNPNSNELARNAQQIHSQIQSLKLAPQNQNTISTDYNHFTDGALLFQLYNQKHKAELIQRLYAKYQKIDAKEKRLNQIINNCFTEIINSINLIKSHNNSTLANTDWGQLFESSKARYKQIEQDGLAKNEELKDLFISHNIQISDVKSQANTVLKNLEKDINQLRVSKELERQKNGKFTEFYNRWREILADPEKRAIEDWAILEDSYIESCNVVAISCNENERTLTENSFNSFDVVIIDEVSKATPIELLAPLMRASKAILVGDHKQLPPVFNESSGHTFEDEVNNAEDEDENSDNETTKVKAEARLTQENFEKYQQMVTSSLFKELFEQAPQELKSRLDVQFRMHPAIMRMVNQFYDNQLVCGNENKDRSHGFKLVTKAGVSLLDTTDHVLWVDTSDDEQGNRYRIPKGNNVNELEARLIAKTLKELDQQAQASGKYDKDNRLKVGVVSFYQPQCRVIRQAVQKIQNFGKDRFQAIDVEINTVIRYQGKEKPVIILSLVKNDGRDRNFKNKSRNSNIARPEFINVAISRAQNLLIVFGARNMLESLDVRLTKIDSTEVVTKPVYKQMFNLLEYGNNQGNMTTAAEFNQIP